MTLNDLENFTFAYQHIIIVTTIKHTSVGDAVYAMSHVAAVHTAPGCRRVDRYPVTGSVCSSKRPSTSCGSSGEAASNLSGAERLLNWKPFARGRSDHHSKILAERKLTKLLLLIYRFKFTSVF